MNGKLHPELARLVLDDEQHLVMGVAEGMLLGEDAIQLQIVAIGHRIGKGHSGALGARIVSLVAHRLSLSLNRRVLL